MPKIPNFLQGAVVGRKYRYLTFLRARAVTLLRCHLAPATIKTYGVLFFKDIYVVSILKRNQTGYNTLSVHRSTLAGIRNTVEG